MHIQLSVQQLQNQDEVFAFLSEVFILWSSSIHNSVVKVTVIAPDTERERKKKSKQERAKGKANMASNLVAQPAIHDYATRSLVNTKKQNGTSSWLTTMYK